MCLNEFVFGFNAGFCEKFSMPQKGAKFSWGNKQLRNKATVTYKWFKKQNAQKRSEGRWADSLEASTSADAINSTLNYPGKIRVVRRKKYSPKSVSHFSKIFGKNDFSSDEGTYMRGIKTYFTFIVDRRAILVIPLLHTAPNKLRLTQHLYINGLYTCVLVYIRSNCIGQQHPPVKRC